jgi:hypothetical protein
MMYIWTLSSEGNAKGEVIFVSADAVSLARRKTNVRPTSKSTPKAKENVEWTRANAAKEEAIDGFSTDHFHVKLPQIVLRERRC